MFPSTISDAVGDAPAVLASSPVAVDSNVVSMGAGETRVVQARSSLAPVRADPPGAPMLTAPVIAGQVSCRKMVGPGATG